MARNGTNHQGGPKTPEGKERALGNLQKGNPSLGRNSGRETAEIRNILRQATKDSAPLIAKLATGQSPFKDVPEYPVTTHEILQAFDRCAKFSLPELEPVVEEAFIQALAETLAEDERIPFECIGDIVAKMIEKLSPNAQARPDARDGDVSGSTD